MEKINKAKDPDLKRLGDRVRKVREEKGFLNKDVFARKAGLGNIELSMGMPTRLFFS